MDQSEATIKPLHGLRGIAALLVLVGHGGQATSQFAVAPSLGVLVFFVLSGFLMGHLYLVQPFRTENVWRYAVARVARVYPLFAIVVALAAALSLFVLDRSQPFGFSVGQLVPHLLLAGSSPTVWTISVEFQFYAAFLVLWLMHSRLAHTADLLLVLCCVAIAAMCWISGPWLGRIDLPRYFPAFALGVTGSVIKRHIPERWPRLSGVVLTTSLLFLAYVYVDQWGTSDHEMIYADVAVVVAAAILVVCAAAAPLSPAGEFLGSRPLVWLGEISFAVYLLHRVVIFAFYQMGAGAWPPQVTLAAIVLATFLVASVAQNWFERPARHALRLAGEKIAQVAFPATSRRP